VLIPDFKGSSLAVGVVAAAGPDVIGHNLETVPGLYRRVRRGASYKRSLQVLAEIKRISPGVRTKSGIMLGLGEREGEVIKTLKDLRQAGCDFLTLGQYMRPTSAHCEVARYVPPEVFDRYRRLALEMGFARVVSSPLARSSYRAEEMLKG
jgi:lipoic acid synthetase